MDGSSANIWVWIFYILFFIAVMYLLIIRPNKKKKKEEENLRNNLSIGDEITTIGGIVGRIVSIKDESDSLVLETGVEHNKIKIKRWAVAGNNSQQAEEKPVKK